MNYKQIITEQRTKIKKIIGHFLTISQHFGSLPKASLLLQKRWIDCCCSEIPPVNPRETEGWLLLVPATRLRGHKFCEDDNIAASA